MESMDQKASMEAPFYMCFEKVSESLQRFHADRNVIGHEVVSQMGMSYFR